MKRFAPSVISGALLALAFPPFGLSLLAFVALVPLLSSLHESPRGGFSKGYIFGFVFALPNMFWLYQFVSRWTNSAFLGCVPWLMVCAAFAVYYGFFGMAVAKAMHARRFWLIPLAWAGVEVVRSTIPVLFFPWSLLGASLWRTPVLLQSAQVAGPYFVSAWIVLASVIVYLLFAKTGEARSLWRMVGVWVGVCALSIGLYVQPVEGRMRTFSAIQPGVDLAFTSRAVQAAELSETIPKAIARGSALHRDLIVLPEGLAEWNDANGPTAPFSLDFREPTMLGGKRNANGKSYQSAFAWDTKWQFADKRKLVIFGEYVPLRDKLPFLSAFHLPSGDLVPSDVTTTLTVGEVRVGALLCFEALFEEVARTHAENGAEVLAVMSLDDWYQGTGAIDALRGAAVLRAIENGIPVVRSAPLGPSMIIDARGNIAAEAMSGVTTSAQAQVICRAQKPIALRAWFPWLSVLAFVFALFLRRAKE